MLDEFDKILELGFLEEMEFILGSLPAVEKRMLTSATHAVDIPAFTKMQQAVTLNFLSDKKLTRTLFPYTSFSLLMPINLKRY